MRKRAFWKKNGTTNRADFNEEALFFPKCPMMRGIA